LLAYKTKTKKDKPFQVLAIWMNYDEWFDSFQTLRSMDNVFAAKIKSYKAFYNFIILQLKWCFDECWQFVRIFWQICNQQTSFVVILLNVCLERHLQKCMIWNSFAMNYMLDKFKETPTLYGMKSQNELILFWCRGDLYWVPTPLGLSSKSFSSYHCNFLHASDSPNCSLNSSPSLSPSCDA
jgi:hypothetical protein